VALNCRLCAAAFYPPLPGRICGVMGSAQLHQNGLNTRFLTALHSVESAQIYYLFYSCLRLPDGRFGYYSLQNGLKLAMHIHILGICGTFMGGLAALAHEAGHKVTGCDAGVYPPMSDQLRALGIDLIEGFGTEQLALKPDMFVIGNVVSRAHRPDGSPKFPLMEAIMAAGLSYTSGPQWLAEHVLQGRHVLAVAGTHGKTTTTAMLSWILECAGLNPGFLVGGVPLNFGVSARQGSSNCFVIEADEYDTAFFDKRSKFVHYRPRTAVLNNLEFDHADIFDDLAAIERQFHHLVRTVPGQFFDRPPLVLEERRSQKLAPMGGSAAHEVASVGVRGGRVVVNGLEESLTRVLNAGCWSEIRSFGAAVSDFTAVGEPHQFNVFYQGQQAGRVEWALTGMHNQLNALAAIAAADHVGVPVASACQALASFENVKRRMEVIGRVTLNVGISPNAGAAVGSSTGAAAADLNGTAITLYDDFAHHPTAIRTTVDGLRRKIAHSQHPHQRILAVFEPRSNTMKLGAMKSQLPWSLEQADLAFCHSGGLGWDAADALAPMGARAKVAHSIDELVTQVAAAAQAGDHIVGMSNGGFGGFHQKLLAALKTR
jgi:UDP-N-acetylmuramate: L-alanyl-gamma-D-glutamyl-meso-diaminopimelate ligase